ncbi:MAG TPA: type II secretion system F family protein [Patescibacteria group bacterium]|nr:type II secretion system F family protein [Patescibacteria group bacterium]
MLLFACILVFLSVTLLLGAFGAEMASAPRRAAVSRLRSLRGNQPTTYEGSLADSGAPDQARRAWWQAFWPARKQPQSPELAELSLKPESQTGMMLLHAGYRSSSAVTTYLACRMAGALVLALVPIYLTMRGAVKPNIGVLVMSISALVGYLLPKMVVRMQMLKRQHRLRLSLPDALDLLVVCVEAGMGLNQAIVRVSEELRNTHPEIADEFRLVNLEIRAGRTRPDALRSMGDRTGVDDIISLASMIIQTDKFGTSIARSLRVHSDSLRTERRQRAEEAAAKTTIKLIFPLLFCIFPSLFVIILGPAALHLWKIFGQVGK